MQKQVKEMMDNLFQHKTNCKDKMGQIVKEPQFLLNNKDQKLQIIYKKVEKEKNQQKIL